MTSSRLLGAWLDLRLLLIYFHLITLLPRLPRLARHRTRALRHSPRFTTPYRRHAPPVPQ
jgi:hypothetical protein